VTRVLTGYCVGIVPEEGAVRETIRHTMYTKALAGKTAATVR